MMGDLELLNEYVRRQFEEAFATLVARHIDMVYSVALRQVGNPHHAQEITQAVFVILARKSASLDKGTILAGWLHRTTRLTALQSLRAEIRRAHREQEAYVQSLFNEESEAEVWSQVGPLLEDAIDGLREKERNAVVLRFLEGKGLREVGLALGTTEDAAQKLVSRAVEKLRNYFVKRGLKVSAGVLVAAVSANSLHAAPVGLAGCVTATAALKGAAATPSSLTLIKGTLKLMAWTKIKTVTVVAVGLLIAGGTTTIVVKEIYPSEPSYQGKTLTKWLEPTFRLTATGSTEYWGEEQEPVRHMGKKSIPFLLHMLQDNSKNAQSMQKWAAHGFRALGPLAEDAIPELSRLVTNRFYVYGAAESLAGVSPKALPSLLNALTNKNKEVRIEVVAALGSVGFSRHQLIHPLGEDASAAIAAIIICTSDVDPIVRAVAAGALGNVDQEPELVVPVLIEKLKDPDPRCRLRAAQSLGFFTTKARSAIPALTEATNDSDETVRRLAKEAIVKITTGKDSSLPPGLTQRK